MDSWNEVNVEAKKTVGKERERGEESLINIKKWQLSLLTTKESMPPSTE